MSRCLEKDPENRWPTADALRRALENRAVVGYQPTGLGWRAGRGGTRPGASEARRRTAARRGAERDRRGAAVQGLLDRGGSDASPAEAGPRPARPLARRGPPAAAAARPRQRGAGARYRRAADRAAGAGAVRQLGGGLARLLRDQRRHRTRHPVVPLPDLRHGDRDAAELRQALAVGLQLARRADPSARARRGGDDDGQGRQAAPPPAPAHGRRLRRPPARRSSRCRATGSPSAS